MHYSYMSSHFSLVSVFTFSPFLRMRALYPNFSKLCRSFSEVVLSASNRTVTVCSATLSFRERRMYACQMEKIKSGIICVVKKHRKKVSEAHFQKVLKRQKSANSTKKCSNDNLKSAQTTIFIKRCISTEKSFCNILGIE